MALPNREGLSKRIRFEIFKRDSFSCQYCGATAPEVVLHVDHIIPVAGGGKDDPLNLVTACAGCNLGKSDRALDDASVITRQHKQLADLQERRNQLELMADWQNSLLDVERSAVNKAVALWGKLAPGPTLKRVVHREGRDTIEALIRKYGLLQTMDAMRVSAKRLIYNNDGTVTITSFFDAFGYIRRVLAVKAASAKNPHAKSVAYIIGILRNRLDWLDYRLAGNSIQTALSWGTTFEEIRGLASSARSFNRFNDALCGMIDEAIKNEGV